VGQTAHLDPSVEVGVSGRVVEEEEEEGCGEGEGAHLETDGCYTL